MESESPDTVILLSHGAWHIPEHYSRLQKLLEQASYPVSAHRHPSVNGSVPPNKTFQDDVDALRAKARDLIDQGLKVVVLCHSYGGMVATNAFNASHAYTERSKNGQSGGIIRLIYMCAFLPQIGMSAIDYVTDPAAGAELEFNFNDKGNLSPKNPIVGFYADVKEPDQSNAVDMLTTFSVSTVHTKSEHTAWKHFPLTYLYYEDDKAIPFRLEQTMVKAVIDAGFHVDTITFKASHSPFLSIPVELADAIVKVIKDTAHT